METEKEHLEQLLKNAATRSFIHVASEINGEMKIYDEAEYEQWCAADRKAICEWRDGYNSFGHFDNELLISATRLYLVRQWHPNPPYSWEEWQLYVLK